MYINKKIYMTEKIAIFYTIKKFYYENNKNVEVASGIFYNKDAKSRGRKAARKGQSTRKRDSVPFDVVRGTKSRNYENETAVTHPSRCNIIPVSMYLPY
ncbi:hypothetical protein DWW36_19420 [Erysipelotrichaceae bacterium AF15-26LB]|nr:hypothetical protein DWX45_21290 [Erysipelotrichaceae bacterium AF19-24AC]RJV82745.1 hypothetical protein DWW36_19420 [Erysipelotrichaceae bacterium AF15-26LB]